MKNILLLLFLSLLFTCCSKDDSEESDNNVTSKGSIAGTVIYNGNSGRPYNWCYLYDISISDVITSLATQEHNAYMNYNFNLANQIANSLANNFYSYIKYSVITSGTTYDIKNVETGTYLLLVTHGTCYYYPNIFYDNYSTDGVSMSTTTSQYKIITVNEDQITTTNFVFQDFTSYVINK